MRLMETFAFAALSCAISAGCSTNKKIAQDVDGGGHGTDDGPAEATVELDVEPSPYAAGMVLDWASSFGGDQYDSLGGPIPRPGGGMLLGGFHGGTVVFGEGEANEIELTAGGPHDGLAASVGADGSVAWVATGGADDESEFDPLEAWHPLSEVDGGGVEVCGGFAPGAVIGVGSDNEVELGPISGTEGTFLARIAPGGTPESAQVIADGVSFFCLPVEGGDGFYVAGELWSSATVGPGPLGGKVVSPGGVADGQSLVFGRFFGDGTLDWVRVAGSDEADMLTLGVLPGGDLLLAGVRGAEALVPDGTGGMIEVGEGGFLARVDGDGELVWWRGSSSDPPSACAPLPVMVSAGPKGDVYLFGSVVGGIGFDDGAGGIEPLEVGGAKTSNLYLVRYDAEGTLIRARCLATSGSLTTAFTPNGVTALSGGGAIVYGTLSADAVFFADSAETSTAVVVSEDAPQMPGEPFAAFVGDGVDPVWVKHEKSGGFFGIYNLVQLEDGSLGVVGAFSTDGSLATPGAEAVLGVGDPNETILAAHGSFDGFFGRYVPAAGQ